MQIAPVLSYSYLGLETHFKKYSEEVFIRGN